MTDCRSTALVEADSGAEGSLQPGISGSRCSPGCLCISPLSPGGTAQHNISQQLAEHSPAPTLGGGGGPRLSSWYLGYLDLSGPGPSSYRGLFLPPRSSPPGPPPPLPRPRTTRPRPPIGPVLLAPPLARCILAASLDFLRTEVRSTVRSSGNILATSSPTRGISSWPSRPILTGFPSFQGL